MGTFIIATVLAIIVGAIVIGIVKQNKKGINPICGCSCEECHKDCSVPEIPEKIT